MATNGGGQGHREDSKALLKPVGPPDLSLPKGGGALRSIGEKFTAGGPTGTGSLNIPLATSPGRGGFGPELALTYDSGNGSGPFGIGHRLAVPQITRRTDKGLPRYEDADESDIFVLSGAEDLVPSLIAGNGHVRDSFDDGEERVDRYRPRTEGLFARVERRTHRATGISYFRAITSDNVTSLYGLTQRGRIFDPSDERRVFTWLLEATFDSHGNVTVYDYKAEDLAGVRASDVSEASRLASPPVNRYLKRVRYSSRAPLATRRPTEADLFDAEYLFEAVLDYGEHTDDSPVEGPPWSMRQDPTSTFRAGFEIRTYRLCRRLLMFHRMSEVLDEPATLVRATELTYEETPFVTYLREVRQVGYRPEVVGGPNVRMPMPALRLDYSRADELDPTVHDVDPESLRGMPSGINGPHYQLVDLDGEGIAGVLAVPDGPGLALRFKRNLGGGHLGEPATLPSQPSTGAVGARLLSLDADGRLDVVELGGPTPGRFERTRDGEWLPFAPFSSLPAINFNNPNLRFVDLDGDGLADVLVAEDEVFVWYPSLAREGFGSPRRVARSHDERSGPRVMFSDEREGIFLADMTGDGLSDIVRIRNGDIAYWPNLGYGRFGAKITMKTAPRLDPVDAFEPHRIRLGDIDGSGTADLVYAGSSGIVIHRNQAGNGWGDALSLPAPSVHALSHLDLADFLGTGTSCLVWSSHAPGDAATPLKYVDLLKSTKPHLLVRSENGLGAETRITYAPSTRFYLEDRRAGRPWVTRAPFPVHVVAEVEVRDLVQSTRFFSRYRYAHALFDGVEREFRGFARVDQWDTEAMSKARSGAFPEGLVEVDDELRLPPVHTITWYHTGAWTDEGDELEAALKREYYKGDPQAAPLEPSFFPANVNAAELREAHRALKGRTLRSEVYAEDGSAAQERPYVVTEHRYEVRLEQALAEQRHAVLYAFERETLTAHYERDPIDPRIGHELVLEVDLLGHVRRRANLAYPRRGAGEPEQKRLLATCALTEVAPLVSWADDHRHGVATESSRYEIVLAPTAARPTLRDVDLAMTHAIDVGLDVPATLGKKRIAEQVRHRYFKDDLSGPLAFGVVEARALVFDHYALALPATLVAAKLPALAPGELVAEAGYVDIDGDAWAHAGLVELDPAHFYQPISFTDLFGNKATVVYDDYRLFVVEEHTSTVAAFDNVTSAVIDYRALQPVMLTDPNGDRNAVALNALGLVTATAVMGHAGAAEGDTLDDPTTRVEYALLRWEEQSLPTFVHTITREEHRVANQRFLHSYSYSDGSGHEVLKKAQAEAAPDGAKRWVGSGRVVFDNKGNPIKKFEPYFSLTSDYEHEPSIVMVGYTSINRYDPLSRLVRTDFPDGTFATVTFDPWSETRHDANDNVVESAWYADRMALPAGNPARRAAILASDHAHTPAVHHTDPFGRTFLSVADNGSLGKSSTRLELDIDGEHVAVTDARGVVSLRQTRDGSGHVIEAVSADAGTTTNVFDALGRPYRSWDSRGYTHRKKFDVLRRLTHVYVTPPVGATFLAERIVYGEGLANLRGRLHQHYDGAGVLVNDAYDYDGRITRSTRRLARTFRSTPVWDALDADRAPAGYLTDAEALLEPDVFVTQTAYDAMSRVKRLITPDGTKAELTYNEAALLDRVDVHPRGAVSRTPLVRRVDYNARGQRVRIDHGRGVTTLYAYDDRSTMLIGITTTRDSDGARVADLGYTYDPAHNIVQVDDGAQPDVYYAGDVVGGTQLFEYDALYRLKRSEGREHPGQVGYALGPNGYPDAPVRNIPHPNDLEALLRYFELFTYDEVGNIQSVAHRVPANPINGWTRRYSYEATSNRLFWTSLPGDADSDPPVRRYRYDERGNTTQTPHLATLGWDHDDRFANTVRGTSRAYYVYDSQGQRVRKVIEANGTVRERVYVGNFERYRELDGVALETAKVTLERETVHAFDGHKRVALLETVTTDPAKPGPTRVRLQLANNLGTATVEVDLDGGVISYEELYAFGGTSFRAGEPDKRYRYGGKERDEETGFYYHGARYYAPWLGRWISPDPAGLVDGTDVYAYVENNPIKFGDPTGLWEWPSPRTMAIIAAVVVVGAVVTVATAGAAGPLVGAAVASIGLSGTAATVATGVVVGAVAGAAGGMAGEVARTGLTEHRFPTGRELGHAAAVGAALGAVTGGLGAFASTARGVQAASTVARAAARIPGAGVAARAVATVGRAATAVAKTPGIAQAVRVTSTIGRGAGRAFSAIERVSGSAGIRAARGLFSNPRAASFLDAFSTTRNAAAAFGATERTAEKTITLYRGVNENHALFEQQSTGVVTPNRRWFHFGRRSATALEHNTVAGATLDSPYTSWTTNEEVAVNFALRPNGGGTVLTAEVPLSSTVTSPNLKEVLLKQGGGVVSESEVLVRGVVRATTRTVQ